MSYEFFLALKMACGNSESAAREEYFGASMQTYCSTTGICLSNGGADDIISEIDQVLADASNYELGEDRPTEAAATALKAILAGAENEGAELPSATVSTYYGELDVTWQRQNRTLRLVTYSDARPPMLYFCVDDGEALTRGEAIQPASATDLSDKITWLNS